jgi:RecB family exonuclease
VPTRAAAWQLRRTLESLLVEREWRPGEGDQARLGIDATPGPAPLPMPDLLTRDDWQAALAAALPGRAVLSELQREVVLRAACREAIAHGIIPPFTLRPRLPGAVLAFYDALRRRLRTLDDLDRVVGARLEESADSDRGAARLLAQTRFLSAACRGYERRLDEDGTLDEHEVRRQVLAAQVSTHRHLVVTMADQAGEPWGLWPCDVDLLLRLAGLQRVDIVATEEVLASGVHERLLDAFPGIVECRPRDLGEPPPVLVAPPRASERLHFVARDREAELASVLQRLDPGPAAIVYQRPLPYLYLARHVLDAAGRPFQAEDALPLAAEPYAAVLDLLLDALASPGDEAAREALLASPHVRFSDADAAALPATLQDLSDDGPMTRHLDRLAAFLDAHDAGGDPPPRHRRARAAVLGTLRALRDAHARCDDPLVGIAEVAGILRRWIEAQTFAAPGGDGDLRLVDAVAARYCTAADVHVIGLVEGDWPAPAVRTVLYPGWLLRDLGWPPDALRQAMARACFVDLLRLAGRRTSVSSFLLEHDAVVAPSALVEDIDRAALAVHRVEDATGAIATPPGEGAGAAAAEPAWRTLRRSRSPAAAPQFHGVAGPQVRAAFAVTSLEKYAECPFRYFASRVLRLEDERPQAPGLDPRRWGTLVHGVFERFFEEWASEGSGAITAGSLDAARTRFVAVVDRELAALPAGERGVERMRLLGSAASPGIGERALRVEAARGAAVLERRLEWDLGGIYDVPTPGGTQRVTLRGVADRVDLLADGTLRVLDYKTGRAPDPGRAIQLPVYGWCAEQRLAGYRGREWRVGEAAYLAFGERQAWTPVIETPADRDAAVTDALGRLLDTVAAIGAGAFPPRPAERRFCATCAFAAVCRKDYVDVA